MTIKHLVLPGGGVNGIKTLGILYKLSQEGIFHINDIESVYATSIGSFLAVLIALKFEWDYIIDYMIKRPWHEAFNLSLKNVFGIFSNRGLFDSSLFEIFFKPFFDARLIPINVTMKQFFDITNTEIHFYSLNLHTFEIVDLSHLTHPDLPLLTAVHMTAALPILICPVFYNNHFYVDGALGGRNYPINYCDKPRDEVLGIFNDYSKSKMENCRINDETSFFEYFCFLCHRLIDNLLINKQYVVNHDACLEFTCIANQMSIADLYETLQSEAKRQELFNQGFETTILSPSNNSS